MSAGLVLKNRYRLLERLATGGMGEVWRARDESLGRPVAVKLLRLELGGDLSARARFESEAQFAAGLQHTGIAQAFDYGEQDGRTFLVMELVPGEPLDEILARDGGLPVEAVLDLLVQAGRALAVAHEAGIVHRDVKPANLMVSPDGTLKITDFGIARRLAAASQTATGMVMGTAHYISPEQASATGITTAADLYSLGVVAFECLAGEPPFDGQTPVEVALKHVRDAPPELPARVPESARALIMELLAKDPADRPAGASALADRALEIRRSLSTGRRARDGRPGQRPAAVDPVAEPLRTGPAPERRTARSSTLSGFDADGAEDNLTSGTGTGQRRTVLAFTSVAAVLLVVGAIVAGSLWKGASGSARDRRDAPRTPVMSPVGGDSVDVPATAPGRPRAGRTPTPGPAVTRPHRTHRIRPSTSPSRKASPTHKPTTKPSRATPTAPEPTPTPTASTTTPSTPSPDPSPTQSGELSSDTKV
ncbi:serine/threonine-protein kinase [Actinomadura violacea]|uniref:non-specific serine/threonine protein kinase n=1 Tax=Actinomadura violacea TaxID=2819934 RepID=A0ABS3RWU1_9ACTN|nr:serine/threonine-protein kinase [Actinomadura violacea]MBO2461225.1 protein kinase [Actinomadura violacea]